MADSFNTSGLDNLFNIIQRNREGLGNSLARIGSGRRLQRAGDDPASNAISAQLRSEIRALTQTVRNADTGTNFVRTAEGGLSNIGGLVARGRELAGQAANGTLNDTQRQSLNQELGQVLSEIDRTAQSAEFNGQRLLDGSLSPGAASPVNIQVGSGSGPENQISLNVIDAVDTQSLGIGNADISTAGGALQALDQFGQATQTVNAARGQVGAVSNRLVIAGNNLGTTIENLTRSESNLGDTDIAAEVSNLQQSLARFETSIRALSIRNRQAERFSGGLLDTLG